MTRKLLTSPKTKVCTKCGKRKPLLSFFSCVTGRAGRQSYCKTCAVVQAREWRKANPDKVRALRRAHRLRNLESIRAKKAAYYAQPRVKEYKKAYERLRRLINGRSDSAY